MEKHQITINERKEISEVENLLRLINDKFKLDEVKFVNFIIAVTEALINAVVHGNKNNPLKKVRIFIKHNTKTFSVEIKDEGTGFNYDSVPDPTTEENILKEHGRGIYIIKSLVDKFDCKSSKKGTTMKLTMVK